MQTKYDRCPNCMQELTNGEDVCPYCSFDVASYEEKSNCLRPFTVLQNKYMIGRIIGIGGFGITYIGWDLNLQTYIAIKEYFPDSIASRDTSGEPQNTVVTPIENKRDVYDKGLKRYVEEAQNISKFYDLKGIVSVKDFFYENGTGYIVMEYINGINLKEYLNKRGGKLDEKLVLSLMKPVLESLYQIHNAGLIHRDISPDNIMVNDKGQIKLIDFGSARGKSAESEKTFTVILKHGYAPAEQYYSNGNQGPWTDIYSICATMYKMLTGNIPPNAVERMENDQYVRPSLCGVAVSQRTESALARGLVVKAQDRYQNIGQLIADLYGENVDGTPVSPVPSAAATGYVNPTSVSQPGMVAPTINKVNPVSAQNPVTAPYMQLNMQPVMNSDSGESKSKKGLVIALVCIAIAAIIVAVTIIIVASNKKDKDKKTTTEISTTSSTDTGTTTETVEPQGYQWPETLSDSWTDYQIKIDGVIYELPIKYSDFMSQGWSTDSAPSSVGSGQSQSVDVNINGLEVSIEVANYALTEQSIDECYVVSLCFLEYNDCSGNHEIYFPGNLEWKVSGTEDVKKAYGAPDYIDDDNDYQQYTMVYSNEEYDSGYSLCVDKTNDTVLYFGLYNSEVPEEVDIDPSQMSNEPPAINSEYVAPSGPSENIYDGIITLDGVNYLLPCPVSEFTANGWKISNRVDDVIYANSSCSTELEKDGSKISISIDNYTSNSIIPVNGYVSCVSVEPEYCSLEVVFPGGITCGAHESVFINQIPEDEMYSYKEEPDSFLSSAFYAYLYGGEGDEWSSIDYTINSGASDELISYISYTRTLKKFSSYY